MINLENDSGHDVQMMLVKYDYEPQFTDDRYFKYSQGQQKTIERYHGRKYFVFVSDVDYVYGFILEGGSNYSYKGKGKMWDCSNNKWSEFKLLEDRPGQIGFYALLDEASLYLEGEKVYLRENEQVYVNRAAGRYVIGYDSNYQNIINKYAVESGVSYYIAKGQMIVECNTNIILKPYKQGDVHDPNPTQKKVTTLSEQGKVVIKNGTNEEVQVAVSIDIGSSQSNSYYKLAANGHDGWGRTHGSFYQCCVFYRSVVYNFIVQAGRSYVFQATLKLIDIESNTPVTYDDLWDENGVVSVRAMSGGEFTVSVSGGNEGSINLTYNATTRFYRQNGNYILSILFNGQEKKYQVSSGNAYYVWAGNLICYRTSIYAELYIETTTTTVVQVNQNKDGKITIKNGVSGQVNVSVAKDQGSNQTSEFFTLLSGRSDTWARYCDNEYQCYILDPDTFTYGFIIMGGGNYTYQGQGKLWDNDKGILAEEDDLNLSTPGFVIVKAFRCNVQVTLTGGNDNSFDINQNQYVRFTRKPGNYILRFSDLQGAEKKYLVSSGRSYYIYNSGSCIDKDSNVVLPLYTENQGSIVTYDDENINKMIQINGGSSSWQQWSSSYSNKTQVSYSKVESHSSSSFIQSSNISDFQSNFNNLGGNITNFTGGMDINKLQGMTGGNMVISNFNQNSSAFQQMSGMSMQSSSFSSSKTESYSSQNYFQSSNQY